MTVNQISNELLKVWHGDDCCHIESDGRFYFIVDDTPIEFVIERDRAFIEAGAIPDWITPSNVYYKLPNFNTEMFVDRVKLIEKYLGRKAEYWSDCIIFGGNKNDMIVQSLINFGFPLENINTCGPCGMGLTVNELMGVPDYEFSPLRDEFYRISVSFIDYKGNIITHLHRSMAEALGNIKSVLGWAINGELDDPDEDRINNILNGVTLDNYREVANKWAMTVKLTEHWS